MAVTEDVTPYTTVKGYVGEIPTWAPTEEDNERLAAYMAYENMYWSVDKAFSLIRRNDDGKGIYIPKPKVIVDTTSHYLLKGLHIGPEDPEKNKELGQFLNDFLARERFYSRFNVAKLAGVARGDWLFHITADPTKPEGTRLSLTSIDPGMYFPEYDTDDAEKRTGVKLVEQTKHPDDPSKTVVRVLRYWQNFQDGKLLNPTVWREENLWEMEGWNNPKKAKKVAQLIPAAPLPLDITHIPVYHFKNAEWDGFNFGNSELKGYERIFQAIDQAISDEEIALALVGLGVYATDAGRPKNPTTGQEEDWIVAPGMVWEMPGATMVKRLEGITSVTPVLDHVRYLEESLFEGTGTTDVALGKIDTDVAESGIALAMKFIPTLAKIEYRDTAGVEILTQMWYDWKFWVKAYESKDFTEQPIVITLGEKLPLNRPKVIEELNNFVDRKIISRQYYRQQIKEKLGYVLDPVKMEQEVIAEQVALAEAMMQVQQQAQGEKEEEENNTQPQQNRSNNRERTNESNGTEVRS